MRAITLPAFSLVIRPIINANPNLIGLRQFSSSSPTTTAIAIILQENPGCCLVSSALSSCTSLSPGFTTMDPTQQAQCLCYSSTSWAPSIFDNAVKSCADFASTACTYVYTPVANLQNFCSGVGSVSAVYAPATPTTSAPSKTGLQQCDLVNSYLSACTQLTPGFMTMPPTDQASCLCYVSSTTWSPSLFDNAVSTCAAVAKTSNAAIYSAITSLHGFCGSIGNIFASKTGGSQVTQTVSPTPAAPGATSATATGTKTQSFKTGSSKGSGGSSGTATGSTTDLTITIGQAGATSTSSGSGKNNAGVRKVDKGEVVWISFACTLLVLFLC